MTDKSQRWEDEGGVVLKLNKAIDDLNITKETMSTTPAYPLFDSVAALLATIRVSSFLFCDEMCETHRSQDRVANKQYCVNIGLFCAEICKTLERGMGNENLNDLSEPACDAINELTT